MLPGMVDVARLTQRFKVEATDRGIRRLRYGRGTDHATPGGRRHVARARRELAAYLAGRRVAFAVPLDLAGLPPFQARVLGLAARIPYGQTRSYSELARRAGRPRAARAVGNALATNPLPIFVPCHRVIRRDGTWRHYAFGAWMKTRLLALERSARRRPRARRRRA